MIGRCYALYRRLLGGLPGHLATWPGGWQACEGSLHCDVPPAQSVCHVCDKCYAVGMATGALLVAGL